jgi:VWFA-related protein
MRRLNGLLIAVACLGLTVAPAGAQDESQQFVGETTVNVVEVPVRVIDTATGEPVTGLDPSEFVITESGVVQPISNFSEIERKVAVRTVSEEGLERTADPTSAEITKPLEIVYFFDLYLMYTAGRDRAVEGLQRLYQEGVPDGESVSVVFFDGELETLVDRSDYRREILDAIDEIGTIEPRGINQRVGFTEALSGAPVTGERDTGFYERKFRNIEYMQDLERKIAKVGNAMLATMARFARADGRRVLVAFTPGFPRSDWAPTYYSVDYLNAAVEWPQQDLWKKIANEASDLGFTLYNVDTSGVWLTLASDVTVGMGTVGPTDVESNAFGAGRDQFQSADSRVDGTEANSGAEPVQNMGQWLETARKNLLIQTAQETGGEAIFASDVHTVMKDVRQTLDHYYSLGYTAEHSGDGKTYSLDVELPNHPSYRVVHRTTFVDLPASTRSAQALRSEMLFGGDANPLGVRVEAGDRDSRFRLGAAGSKRVRIPLKVKIPYGRLMMIPRGDVYWGKVLVTFFGEDGEGNQSELATFEQPITVATDRYEEAVARGYFTYKATVEIEGGQQSVFVGVQDTLDGRTTIIPMDMTSE